MSSVEKQGKEANNYGGRITEQKVLVGGKEVFIGVDVHKESWHVTVHVEEEEIFHGRIHSGYDASRKLLDHFKDCNVKGAYEAGPCGFWLHDRLIEDGVEVVVAPPSLNRKEVIISLIFWIP